MPWVMSQLRVHGSALLGRSVCVVLGVSAADHLIRKK